MVFTLGQKGTRMFTAAVLGRISVALVTWILRGTIDLESKGFYLETPGGDPIPHHMTINLGSLNQSLNPPTILGQTVFLHINQLVYDTDLGVCAAPVFLAEWQGREICTIHAHPHITVCLKPGVKPVLSNKLLEQGGQIYWLDESYCLNATVQECD